MTYIVSSGALNSTHSLTQVQRKQQMRLILPILQAGEPSSKRDQSHTPLHPVETHSICTNLGNNLWQKCPPQSTK